MRPNLRTDLVWPLVVILVMCESSTSAAEDRRIGGSAEDQSGNQGLGPGRSALMQRIKEINKLVYKDRQNDATTGVAGAPVRSRVAPVRSRVERGFEFDTNPNILRKFAFSTLKKVAKVIDKKATLFFNKFPSPGSFFTDEDPNTGDPYPWAEQTQSSYKTSYVDLGPARVYTPHTYSQNGYNKEQHKTTYTGESKTGSRIYHTPSSRHNKPEGRVVYHKPSSSTAHGASSSGKV